MASNSQNNGIKKWVVDNSWVLLVMLFSLGVLYAEVKGDITVNAQGVSENKETIAEYPSEDWFNLKFQNIDERFDNLEEK